MIDDESPLVYRTKFSNCHLTAILVVIVNPLKTVMAKRQHEASLRSNAFLAGETFKGSRRFCAVVSHLPVEKAV